MEKIKKVEIHDKIFEETYTAHIQSNGTNWLGWIPEVPKVKCEEPTEAVLLKILEKKLHEVLVAEEEAWEKQFEADVKTGKLDKLREEALADVRAEAIQISINPAEWHRGIFTKRPIVFGRIIEGFRHIFKDLQISNFNCSRKTQVTRPLISRNLKDMTIGQPGLQEVIEQ